MPSIISAIVSSSISRAGCGQVSGTSARAWPVRPAATDAPSPEGPSAHLPGCFALVWIVREGRIVVAEEIIRHERVSFRYGREEAPAADLIVGRAFTILP